MSMTDGAALAPSVSVVICAYTEHRWDDLRSAVESVLGQTHHPLELIVVIDHNEALLARSSHAFSSVPEGYIRVLANERRRGLSGARNTAIAAASGQVVAFLDDDAVAAPDWLESLLVHYSDPSVMGVGGVAQPQWPDRHTRPVTLPAAPGALGELDWVVGCSYAGLPTSVAPLRNLMGCNMSIRAAAFETVGGFRETIGRIGRTPLGDEETELCIRVRQQLPGSEFIHEPAARVVHRMTADRLTWRYLLHRGYAEGLSKAAISSMVGPDDALASERTYVASVLPRAVLRELRRCNRAGALGAAAVLAVGAVTAFGYARGLARVLRSATTSREVQPAAPVPRADHAEAPAELAKITVPSAAR
ncbi:glycosyltransferase family 2 protein [Flexivirga meconopsidis]|uniref:glycosyltransferase family 2 protein n=1 Tax=Flexivirga meconopsidis TaxID=2977121 RepID=UPI002240D8DE|nr:glycosyltransferase [Flexivirga meconopsidis]